MIGNQSAACAIVVMGVSGSGKSSLGCRLAEALNAPFVEGDAYHSAHDLQKMRQGNPLTDQDRWPWLERLGRAIADELKQHGRVVAACSALKRAYRERLRLSAGVPIVFICLRADARLLSARLNARKEHFFPASLLSTQLSALELPDSSEDAIILDAGKSAEDLAAAALSALSERCDRTADCARGIPPGEIRPEK